jgi:23S rRNA (cytosine1962-C5)-methyltransferase
LILHSLAVQSAWASRITKGYPWVYAHGLVEKKPFGLKPGDLVQIVCPKRQPVGIGYYNPNSSLACRILTLDQTQIDEAFFISAFTKAKAYRERFFKTPYYRLIHAEGDRLPGLIIDRFNDTVVCQTSTAGMEKLKPIWLNALQTVLAPTRIIFRDNVPSRLKEGLKLSLSAPIGELEGLIEVQENGLTYFADPFEGQKTGWFYDQRANRRWIMEQAAGKTVLDLYTYSGGFGLAAAFGDAKTVTMIDASEKSLALAQRAAMVNNLSSQCTFVNENIFTTLPRLVEQNQRFDLVVADPPAFIKQKNLTGQGLAGYQKLAKLTSQLVAPGGMLFIASCSHHASPIEFQRAVESGIQKGERQGTLLRQAGADKDHPLHGQLPETQYLKSLAYILD